MKKVLKLIVVLICVVAVSAVVVYYYHKKDRPPEVVDYKDFAALQKDVERLEAARGKHGLSWQDNYRLGIAYIQSGRVEDAIAPLEESRKLNQSFVKTHESLGTAYFRTGRMKEAIDAWQNAMKLNPEAKFLEEMVSMAKDKVEVDERLASLEAKLKEVPGNADWHKMLELSALYMQTGRLPDAREILDRALKVKKDSAEIYDAMAETHALGNDFEGAVSYEKRALKLKPKDPRLKQRLAEMEKILAGVKKGAFHKKEEKTE